MKRRTEIARLKDAFAKAREAWRNTMDWAAETRNAQLADEVLAVVAREYQEAKRALERATTTDGNSTGVDTPRNRCTFN